jgi:hypothetical protein
MKKKKIILSTFSSLQHNESMIQEIILSIQHYK